MGFVAWSDVPKCEAPRVGHVSVYALVDPRDATVRYVGVTSKRLEERLERHLLNPTNPMTRAWFRELKAAGLRPEIVRLQNGARNWERAEMEWIAWFRVRGDLLNVDAGGNLAELGSGWDDLKRERIVACMATARAHLADDRPPPCAQDQRTGKEKRSGRKRRSLVGVAVKRNAGGDFYGRLEAEKNARREHYEKFGCWPMGRDP